MRTVLGVFVLGISQQVKQISFPFRSLQPGSVTTPETPAIPGTPAIPVNLVTLHLLLQLPVQLQGTCTVVAEGTKVNYLLLAFPVNNPPKRLHLLHVSL